MNMVKVKVKNLIFNILLYQIIKDMEQNSYQETIISKKTTEMKTK